jgi:thiamine biosynthesis protein ThiC
MKSIKQIIHYLKSSNSVGLQIKKRNGIITSTWLIYKVNEKYYYFDIDQKIEFIQNYSYTEKEIH